MLRLVAFKGEHFEGLPLGVFDRTALAGQKIDNPGIAFTLMDGDRVLGCAGLIPVDNHAEAWIAMSDELRTRPMILHRLVCGALKVHDAVWPVPIMAVARSEAVFACRWLARLGFEQGDEHDGFIRFQRG